MKEINIIELTTEGIKKSEKIEIDMSDSIEIQLEDNTEKYNKIMEACEKTKREASMITEQGITNHNFPEMDEQEKEDTRKFLDKLYRGELER